MDWQVKENANMRYSLQGMRNYIANEITKDFWLKELYPNHIAKAHIDGDFHIHDLGELNAYCVGWDLQDLLMTGFKGVEGKVACNSPKHLSSALGQMVNFIFTTQGETAGAQAFSNFDTLLAPFIRYDNLSFEEVKQEIQSFVFNMNVATRVGFQTPFSNIAMDLNSPKYLANQPVIIGGKAQNVCYKDFQAEMDIINIAFAEVMIQGDANGRIFTFPIPTYNLTPDFDWDNPKLKPVWEMTAKYGIPGFVNYINSDLNADDARSMCCRLRLDKRELQKRGGGLFGSNPLTGSIGVVTINLPRIGFSAKTKNEFYKQLGNMMDLAKQSLIIKRQLVEKYTEEGLYPYTQFYLRNVKVKTGKYWANHFSTIGLIGMNEACINLLNKNIASLEGQNFANEVLDFMREKMSEFQEETDELFNLEATPGEGTAYRLAKIDQAKFGLKTKFANHKKVLENQADPYYTNSSHLPVGFTEDVFEALDLQNDLQKKYTGGTCFHAFLGERINDVEMVKQLVKNFAYNYEVPYIYITPTFSICPDHGYISGEHQICPNCEQKTEIYSRVVGYIRPVDQWNKGKQAEFSDRKEFELVK